MEQEKNYLEINRENWNKRTETHFKSDFYDVANFILGGNSLKSIESELLGDIQGKSILHLQCHFGQDSISLARLGANVTAVDLSDKAIEAGIQLAADCGESVNFICCDIYDLPKHLDEQFDFVFTTYGTIGWLPDLDRWAQVVSRFLKKGGSFVFAEFHPVVWMFDDAFETVAYRYFKDEAIHEVQSGTYTDPEAAMQIEYVSWNHGIAEVLNALLKENLEVLQFQEFDYSPYNCFQKTEEFEPGKFRIKHLENKIPMVYSLKARKK